MMNKNPEFWIKNITKQNVCLADLQLVVPAGLSWNLLDQKHFKYTLQQLEKSAKDGSLFKKSDKIKIRNLPPTEPIKPGIYVAKDLQPNKPRSLVKIEEKKYEELDFDTLNTSDEKYAAEFAELEEKQHDK